MAEVWRLYDAVAREFDRDRGRSVGEESYLREVVARCAAPHPSVLDLGCGAGEPIARYFLERGWALTGVDAAAAMIALCRDRFPVAVWPGATWIVGGMRSLALDRRFDAVVAWDSFFHLRAADQRAMFPVFRRHAAPRALLLFTSGPAAGEAIGTLYGRDLYHASLDGSEYERLLADHGFAVVLHRVEDPDCGGHTVWLAQSLA